MSRLFRRAALLLALVLAALIAATGPAAANPEHPWYSSQSTICLDNNTGAAGFPIATAGARWSAHPSSRMDLIVDDWCSISEATLSFYNVNNPNRSECIYWFMTFKASHWNGWIVVDRAIAYMNLAHPACWSTPQRKAHLVSMAMGYRLGMRVFSPTSISVMSSDTMHTIPYATDYDTQGLAVKQARYWNHDG